MRFSWVFTGHAKGILIDGSHWETVFGTVVQECLLPVVEDGEAFVGDEQQFAAGWDITA